MPTTFVEFLRAVVSAGPALAKVWPQFVAIYNAVIAIIGDLSPTDTVQAMSAEETQLLSKINALVESGGVHAQALDGKLLRRLFDAAQKHPALLKVLIGMIPGA